nr:receptor-like protein 12 [Ipomoea batatas]
MSTPMGAPKKMMMKKRWRKQHCGSSDGIHPPKDWQCWCDLQKANTSSIPLQTVQRTQGIDASWVYCEVDASVIEISASFGAVIRTHSGLFLAAISGPLRPVNEARLAEALAIKETLSWLKSKQWQKICILTDCQQAFSISYINRSVNVCAHTLARAAQTATDFRETNRGFVKLVADWFHGNSSSAGFTSRGRLVSRNQSGTGFRDWFQKPVWPDWFLKSVCRRVVQWIFFV